MGSISPDSYDFIVVGAGPAGCMVATRLADTPQHPSVLLIEAGGKNDEISARVDAERWITRMNPHQNWSYKSIPQPQLDGRVIDLDRGKGLGGSSAVNFSCWTVGPSADYDEIARLMGDDEWKWTNAMERYKRIESYHAGPLEIPEGANAYLSPDLKKHGLTGPIKIGFPRIWEKSFKTNVDAMYEAGVPHNPDHNSGDPLGLAFCASTAYRGVRSTSADALVGAPKNLTVMTDTEIARITFDGGRARGVETMDGVKIAANREVILSCGSLDTPRVLLHSGIGPREQLTKFGIQVVKDNANVGENLIDHQLNVMQFERSENVVDRPLFYKSKELQAAARIQWEKDQTGPLAEIGTSLGIAYLKNEAVVQSEEFKALPEEVKNHLLQPTTPHWEFIVNGVTPQYFMDPENTPPIDSVFMIMMNGQSKGTARLQSSDPKVPLEFDTKFLTHPYDKRVAIEATRAMLKLTSHQAYQKDTVGALAAPKSDSEEDILAYWRGPLTGSTWHMSGTTVMGKSEKDAVVDPNFKVFGVEGVRIADMSIFPFIVK
jgi:choline dehydrogenase-like flavoprotein